MWAIGAVLDRYFPETTSGVRIAAMTEILEEVKAHHKDEPHEESREHGIL